MQRMGNCFILFSVKEVNLFGELRYRELLTYFSDVLFWQNELGSKFKLRNNP